MILLAAACTRRAAGFSFTPGGSHRDSRCRRSFLAEGSATIAATCFAASLPAYASDSLSLTPFNWTAAYGEAAVSAVPKRKGLPATDVAGILENDLKNGKYILTGMLTSSIFDDNARFVDPNNAVDGLSRYQTALSLLFRPELSELSNVKVAVTGARIIEVDYVASGTLKLPWRPRIEPWQGHIVYTLNNDGLIASQVDTWNITRFDAIRQTFTPGRGA